MVFISLTLLTYFLNKRFLSLSHKWTSSKKNSFEYKVDLKIFSITVDFSKYKLQNFFLAQQSCRHL